MIAVLNSALLQPVKIINGQSKSERLRAQTTASNAKLIEIASNLPGGNEMERASKIPATYNSATKMSGRFICGLPKSADPPHEPKQEHADNCARSINHHISYPSFPVWDEKLMDFIARCI